MILRGYADKLSRANRFEWNSSCLTVHSNYHAGIDLAKDAHFTRLQTDLPMTLHTVLPRPAPRFETRRSFAPTMLALAMQATFSANSAAQTAAPLSVAPVVITGTRVAADPFTLPMAISVIDSEAIQEGQLQVNVSESLQRVPGVNAQNRNNYAQDVQLSLRGFGARSSFGVRGVRLYTDGIPASQPDGQGQVSHFSLTSADRMEVLRGPFSALYGNASGGVIQLFTSDGAVPNTVQASVAAGSNDTVRYGVKASGRLNDGGAGYTVNVEQFETDGPRPHSAATRTSANSKLTIKLSDATTLTAIGNAVNLPGAQDPLGLTRAEFDANPRQVNPLATQFDTRKSLTQTQGGIKLVHRLSAEQTIDLTAYTGSRSATQFQAIPVATQAPATHPGGVIDFDRDYYGFDARFTQRGVWGDLVVGASTDHLNEGRRGYQNFVGTTLGVYGALRRNEDNKLRSLDAYAQGMFRLTSEVQLHAGVRTSSVNFTSSDHYVVAGNPDDSGSVRYSAVLPTAGISYRVIPTMTLYASVGKGTETPTLNELAYRASGATGLNFGLSAAKSDSAEIGAKWRSGIVSGEVAYFDTKTKDEIVVITNSGGRSAFANAGRTTRRGLELSARAQLASGLTWELAATDMQARYKDSFKTCIAAPCTTPSVVIAAGNRLPGLPERSAWTELKYAHSSGFYVAAELKHQGSIVANDLATDIASAVTLVGARVGYGREFGKVRVGAFLRGDNLANKIYSGTVIVNEANRRFFEPAAGRTWLAGVTLSLAI